MQDSFMQELIVSFENGIDYISGLNNTEQSILTRIPAQDKWSPLQIVEHIHITSNEYLVSLKQALPAIEENKPDSLPQIKKGCMGRILLFAVKPQSKVKIKTFKTFIPVENPDISIINSTVETLNSFIEYINSIVGFDYTAKKISSPVSPLITISVPVALKINSDHMQRHINQIKALIE